MVSFTDSYSKKKSYNISIRLIVFCFLYIENVKRLVSLYPIFSLKYASVSYMFYILITSPYVLICRNTCISFWWRKEYELALLLKLSLWGFIFALYVVSIVSRVSEIIQIHINTSKNTIFFKALKTVHYLWNHTLKKF